MRIHSLLSRFAERISVASALLGPALALAACAAPSQYMGIDLASPTVSSEVRSLAQRARAGDKYAQLELGIRFEEGDGVPVDLERARALYLDAAADTPIKHTVYVPAEKGVRPETTYAGVRRGLAEAADRLACLEQIVQVGEEPHGASIPTQTTNECNSKMTQDKEIPTTTMASRATSIPGPRTVSALLEKVEFQKDYIHEPDVPGEAASEYFAVSFSYDHGPPVRGEGSLEPGDRSAGSNAGRHWDAVPIDHDRSHIILFDVEGEHFDEKADRDNLSDFYGWRGDFWLISDRLRTLIEELDPGSIECVEAESPNLALERPYWACLSKRNLEAVDATRSDVRVSHENLAADGEDPFIFQAIKINRGAVFDPEVTKGVHQFWDIDLKRWFWSRELIARAHQAGIKGPRFIRAGEPLGGDVFHDELDKIYAEYS